MYEHPRAPALFLISILLLIILHVFNSAVVQGGSEVGLNNTIVKPENLI